MKIVELKIDDSMLAGFEATSLVESPAIEMDFIAFNKVNMAEMTYNDYPQGAIDAGSVSQLAGQAFATWVAGGPNALMNFLNQNNIPFEQN